MTINTKKVIMRTLPWLIISLVLALVSIFILNQFKPNYQNEEFTVTIQGYVKGSDDFADINSKPLRVEIYPSYYAVNKNSY